MDYSIAGKN